MYAAIKPLGTIVTTLPVGPDMPGVTAGPGFELFYQVDYLLPHREAAWVADGGAAAGCGGIRRPLRRGVHARPDGTAGQGGPVAREVRRPAPRRDMRSARRTTLVARCRPGRRGVIIRACWATSTTAEHGTPLRVADGGALDPLVGPQCSLAVQLRRATGAVIGRSAELEAISQELHEASGRLAAVTLEGEPGIGKTRLLLAAAELASASGFTCVAITADEEIRGPFLRRAQPVRLGRDPRDGRRDAGGGRGQAGGRGHLRA